jgi:hypothetical protein
MSECSKCGGIIHPWTVNELYSGEDRELLNNHPDQLCNSCAWGIDGIMDYADLNEMYRHPPAAWAVRPSISFEDYPKSIPGLTLYSSDCNEFMLFCPPKTRWQKAKKKARQCIRLLLSRKLRRRLHRYQIAAIYEKPFGGGE